MKCKVCERDFPERRKNGKTCSTLCRMEWNRRQSKLLQQSYPPKHKESDILEAPTRRERELMMEGLHRLILNTGDEIALLFGQAQELGRGLHCKGTEARL